MIRLAALLLALAVPFSVGAQPGAAPPEPLLVRVIAVLGVEDGPGVPRFDAGAEGLAPLVGHLPYNHYTTVLQEERETALGEQSVFSLPQGHALLVTPAERTPEGLMRTEALILRAMPDGTAVRAIDAAALLPRNGVFRLEGLALDDGELIVIVNLAEPDGGEGQDQQPQEGQDEEDEQEQQPQEQEPEDSGDDDPAPQDSELSPEELQNLEAILRSLEEMDEREIRDTVNHRREIGMHGREWW